MKRTLTALTLAALATTTFAAVDVTTGPGFDRITPTMEHILSEAHRLNAGESDQDNVVKSYVADGYRQNAGESDLDNVVKSPIA